MAEPTGPLADAVPIAGPRLALEVLPHQAKLTVRGRDTTPPLVQAVAAALGFAPPVEPNRATRSGARTALWLGPGEWRIVAPADDAPALGAALQAAVPRALAGVVDVSDFYSVLRFAGPAARDVLAQGCPLDLHPRAFRTGHCAQSLLAKVDVLLHQHDDAPAFDIHVRWSYAEYLWAWLVNAAQAA